MEVLKSKLSKERSGEHVGEGLRWVRDSKKVVESVNWKIYGVQI